MRLKALFVFTLLLVLTTGVFALDASREINPVKSNKDLILTKSFYLTASSLDQSTNRLVYIAYVAGFLDAVQLEEINDPYIKKFLVECDDLNLGQLTDILRNFYDKHPQGRDIKPSEVLTVLAPKICHGLDPYPSKETEKK